MTEHEQPTILPIQTSSNKIHKLISDVASPYFIHSADNPQYSLVSFPLTGDNYFSWKRSITVALEAKNKFVFVDGTLPYLTDVDIQPLWRRCASMVLAWLMNSMDRSISTSLLSSATPQALWR